MTAETISSSPKPLASSTKFDKSGGARQRVFWRLNPWWAIAALTISLPVIAVVWFLLRSDIDNWLHQRKFDAALWKADVWNKTTKRYPYDGLWPPRLCMVDDLMASKRLPGMTKSEVVDLLGPPDHKTDFVGKRQRSIEATFSYYLGPERGFIRIDSETLILEFDIDDKVSREYIY